MQSPIQWFGASEDEQLKEVRSLVDRFYDEMEFNPDYLVIRNLHPQDTGSSRDKLYYFLSGWLGGPDLYQSRYGHPRLRMRHMPFPIASVERDQWLSCMLTAFDDSPLSKDQVESLMISLFKTADWMRNKPDQDHGQEQNRAPSTSGKGGQ